MTSERRWLAALLAALLSAMLGAAAPVLAQTAAPAAAPASAPAAPPPQISPQDAENLLKTLQDPEARQKFTDQLQALVNAQRSVAPPPAAVPDRIATRMIESLSDSIARFGTSIFNTAAFVADAPNFVAWIERQWADRDSRNRLIEAFATIGIVLVGAFVLEWIADRVLAPARRRLEKRVLAPGWSRVPSLGLYLVIEFVPIAVFLVVAFALLAVVQAKPTARLVTLALINANIFAAALALLAAGAFAPRNPGLRLLPLGDETAAYLHVWVRRIGNIVIYGYFAIEAGYFVGLPPVGRAFLIKLLGVFVALLLIVLVLQNRSAFAASVAAQERQSLTYDLLRRVVPFWHLVAIAYVVLALSVFLVEADGFTYVAQATAFTLVAVALAALAAAVLRRIMARAFQVGEDLARRFPSLEARANRYLQILNVAGTAAIWVLATLAVLQAWGISSLDWLDTPLGARVGSSLFSIGVTAAVALAIWEATNATLERYIHQLERETNGYRRAARLRTIMPLIQRVVIILLAVLCGMVVLSELGLNIGPLIAAGGAVGIAVGFGAQAFVKDFINSAQIILADSLAVGDVVQIGDKSGVVEAITMRQVNLRGPDGTLHMIPFGQVQTISNKTKDYAYAVIEVTVGFGEDIDRVIELLTGMGAELRKDAQLGPSILSDLEVFGIDGSSDTGIGVVLKARLKTWPGKQWTVTYQFRRRMIQAFAAAGIVSSFSRKVAGSEQGPADQPSADTLSASASAVGASTTARATS
ncbi:MAG TPA: mechanosensitive ion channel domain-containing protein [Alphaproteobacteria bacterium]|nr:mechanosensitive ion channel domain-containing protein [Alphaproteobacteria bacterium]